LPVEVELHVEVSLSFHCQALSTIFFLRKSKLQVTLHPSWHHRGVTIGRYSTHHHHHHHHHSNHFYVQIPHCSLLLPESSNTVYAFFFVPLESMNTTKVTTPAVTKPRGPTVKHKRRFCKVEGCIRIVKSQGTCQRHGAKPRECKIVGCLKQAQGGFNGMCKCHARQVEAARAAGGDSGFQEKVPDLLPNLGSVGVDEQQPAYGRSAPPPRQRRVCKVDACDRIVKSQGLCQRHGAIPTKCIIGGCSKQAQGNYRRMCKAHYRELGRDHHSFSVDQMNLCQPVQSCDFSTTSEQENLHRVPPSDDDVSKGSKGGGGDNDPRSDATGVDDVGQGLWDGSFLCESSTRNEDLASELAALFEPPQYNRDVASPPRTTSSSLTSSPSSSSSSFLDFVDHGRRNSHRPAASNCDLDQDLLNSLNDMLADGCGNDTSYAEL